MDAVQLAARPYVPSAQSCLYTISIYHVATAYPGFEPRPGQLSWPKTRLAFLGFLLLLFLFYFFVFCLQHTTKIASPFMGASSWLDLARVAYVGSLIQLAFYLSPLSTGKASRPNYPHCPHPAQAPPPHLCPSQWTHLHLLLLLLLLPLPLSRLGGASAMGNNCGRATLQLDTKTSLHKCTLFGGKLKPKGECPLPASPRMRHTNPSQPDSEEAGAGCGPSTPAAPTCIARLFCESARLHLQAVSHLLSTSESL